MAKVVFSVEVPLADEQVVSLRGQISPEDSTMSDALRVKTAAIRLIDSFVNGGLMLWPMEVQHIEESTGIDLNSGEDLLPYISAVTGLEEGMHVIKGRLDPTFYKSIEETAQIRGWPVQKLIDEMFLYCMENNLWEYVPNQPRHVLMTEPDHKDLEELLGAKFDTGTDLAALIKKFLGADADLLPDSGTEAA